MSGKITVAILRSHAEEHKCYVPTQEQPLLLSCTTWKLDAFRRFFFSQFISDSWAQRPPAALTDCFLTPSQQPADGCIKGLIEWI